MTGIAEVKEMANEALTVAYEAKHKIDSHEDICALRYTGIQDGMHTIVIDIKTLSTRMWLFAGSIIGVLVLIIMGLLLR